MTAPRKRTLFISPQPFFQWRGSPIRVAFDVQALAELGYEVDLLTLPIGEPREIDGVHIHRVPNLLRLRNIPIGPSVWKLFFGVLLLFKGIGMAVRHRYAVIHSVEDAGPIGVLLCSLRHTPLVFEKHSDPSSYKKGALRNFIMYLYTCVESFTIRRAQAMIGTGPGLVEQALEVNPKIAAHHIFDIPSSLEYATPKRVVEVREELQKAPDEVLAMYVGSFAVYQGIDLMFESMASVLREHSVARLVIIGGTPEEIEERTAWLRERGVEDRVTFLGKIAPDTLPNYLAAADVLLSPRIAGTNTPLKLLDYLKAGRAIVATDNTANRLILDERTALLAPPTPEGYAEAIASLIPAPEERERLGRAGQHLIETTYNFEEFKRRLGACYEGVEGSR